MAGGSAKGWWPCGRRHLDAQRAAGADGTLLAAARVFGLARERKAQGGPFHAVADQGVSFKQIAEAIGRQLGIPARSLTTEEAGVHFGPLAMWVAGNGPASSERTRERLGWKPKEADLIADIDHPDYFKP